MGLGVGWGLIVVCLALAVGAVVEVEALVLDTAGL